jgi:hypothetical protein
MDIYINGNKIDYRTENEKTLGEILGAIESECEKAGETITGIRVDGEPVAAEALDGVFAREPSTAGKIELDTISGNDVLMLLRNLGQEFTDCAPRLREISVQLQTGKDGKVMETINAFSISLQNLYQALPLLSITTLRDATPDIDGIALTAWPTELSPLLSDLLDALKKHDTVLVGDLSEYEIAPRIERLGAVLSCV